MNSLIRYSNPMSSLSNWIEEFFNDNRCYNSIDRELTSGNFPRVDITENETSYQIKADLPGMDKKDIAVNIENGVIRIEGEKKEEHKKEHGKYFHLERSYGHFSRSFALPEEVNAEKIEAKMHNGVLEVILPKSERARPKAIEVKVM